LASTKLVSVLLSTRYQASGPVSAGLGVAGLLADDWTVIDQGGRVLTKRQVLDEAFASAERRIESMVVDEVQVRMLGDELPQP